MPSLDQTKEQMSGILPKQITESLAKENPSGNAPTRAKQGFIPMSVPVQRLEVPEIPGYHLHWFRGDPGRLARAQRAGYTYVDPAEVELNNFDLGGDTAVSGNTDMGSRVSVISGDGVGKDGQPNRLILMKCLNEHFQASQQYLMDKNERIAEAVRGGYVNGDPNDKSRYVKQAENLFTPRGQSRIKR